MTKIVKKEEAAVSTRTVEVIAAEIRSYDAQVREFVVKSAIEIGKRLTEAKELVPHGQWGKWLEANVSYSQSTANNFMRVASEYADANLERLGNLSYTQAVALLSLPADEREEFAETNNAAEMSSRELQAAIKEKQQLEEQLKAEQERTQAEQAAREEEARKRAELEQQLEAEMKAKEDQEKTIAELQAATEAAKDGKDSKLVEKLKKDLDTAKKKAQEMAEKAKGFEEELKKKPLDIPATVEVEVIPEETKRELEQLRQREQELEAARKKVEEDAAKQLADMQEQMRKNNNKPGQKVATLFEVVMGTFNQLSAALTQVEDEDQRAKLRGRILEYCDKVKETF